MAARKTTRRSRRLEVGDRVRFRFGARDVVGTIVEDRGLLGAGGRRLFTVRVQLEATDELIFEMPADELQAA